MISGSGINMSVQESQRGAFVIMKRTLLLAVIILFLLVGCSREKAEQTVGDQSNTTGIITTEAVSTEAITTLPVTTEAITTVPVTTARIPADDELVPVTDHLKNVSIDLKYATEDNFTGKRIYDTNVAYLRYGTLKKLRNAAQMLEKDGYTLLIWDAYRPTSAQWKLWEICPDPKFVSDPNKGYSGHSRGNTVDISILKDGKPVEMPSGFDDFSKRADRDYSDVSETAAANASYLESIMSACGFKGYSGEWWHYTDKTAYEVVME